VSKQRTSNSPEGECVTFCDGAENAAGARASAEVGISDERAGAAEAAAWRGISRGDFFTDEEKYAA
jgi:hypothetical protein